MSIIYNALKKTQEKRETKSHKKANRNLLPIFVILIILGIGTASVYFYKYYFLIHHFFHSKPVTILSPIVKTSIPLKLNGIYISDFRKIAMINQNFYPLGSEVDNMKIVEIYDNHIILEDNQGNKQNLLLSTTA